VDDFGVEYVGIEHFNHLLMLLKKYHQIQTNMAGDKIAGINIQWDFPGQRVCIDMQTYIDTLLLTLDCGLAQATKTSTIALHRNTYCIWPEDATHA
jgi:hypothetical protein